MIEGLSWMIGDWAGVKDGNRVLESWRDSGGGTLMGMFAWLDGDRVRFYEFITVEPAESEVVLRIKHFHPGLRGWEDRDESVAFQLVRLEASEAVFDRIGSGTPIRMIYRREGGGLLVSLEHFGDHGALYEFRYSNV